MKPQLSQRKAHVGGYFTVSGEGVAADFWFSTQGERGAATEEQAREQAQLFLEAVRVMGYARKYHLKGGA